jgi:hypothetical protein
MRHAALSGLTLLLVLACGGLPGVADDDAGFDVDLPDLEGDEGEGGEAGEGGDVGLGAPEGPWLFALVPDGDACDWQALQPGSEPRSLARHEGPCPMLFTVGMADDGLPGAGVDEEGQIVVREDDVAYREAPPPTGEARRAGFLDGELTVDTVLASFDGPPSFGGHTYSSPASDGMPALAIRWRKTADGWEHSDIVDTDDGWDYARGVTVLEPALPALPTEGTYLGGAGKEYGKGDLSPGVKPGKQQEGWMVADTPHGKLTTGYFYGEGIALTPPAAVKVGDSWSPVDLSGPDEWATLDAVLAGDWAVLSVVGTGPSVVVSTKTGEELLRSDAQLTLMQAP